MKTDELLNALPQWTNILNETAHDCTRQIRDTLKPGFRLPEGVPSHASMAELILRKVKQRLADAQTAVEDLENAIWATK